MRSQRTRGTCDAPTAETTTARPRAQRVTDLDDKREKAEAKPDCHPQALRLLPKPTADTDPDSPHTSHRRRLRPQRSPDTDAETDGHSDSHSESQQPLRNRRQLRTQRGPSTSPAGGSNSGDGSAQNPWATIRHADECGSTWRHGARRPGEVQCNCQRSRRAGRRVPRLRSSPDVKSGAKIRSANSTYAVRIGVNTDPPTAGNYVSVPRLRRFGRP